MKKSLICLFIIFIVVFLSSCGESNEEIRLDSVTFEMNGKEVTLTSDMDGRAVYDIVLRRDSSSEDWRFSFDGNAPYEYMLKTEALGTGVHEGFQYTTENILKNYSSLFKNEEKLISLFEGSKSFTIKNSDDDGGTETNTFDFYGEQKVIGPEDEGYENSFLDTHYMENVSYIMKKNGEESKSSSITYINTFEDMIALDKTVSFKDSAGYIYSFFSFGEFGQQLPYTDESFSNYVSYSFELTDKHIILKVKANVSFVTLRLANYLYDGEQALEILEEKKELGEMMEAEVYLNYHELEKTIDGKEYLVADKVNMVEKRVNDEIVTCYLTFWHLDIDLKRAEEIRNDIIAKAKSK